MVKVSSILGKQACNQQVSCAPCYYPEGGCYENEFYALAEYAALVPFIVDSGEALECSISSFSDSSSCVSYLDAYNKALEKAMTAALAQLRDCNGDANFATWDAERWSSTEMDLYRECPCGWTGAGEYTIPAGAGEGYTPAEANVNAIPPPPGLDPFPGCTPPIL